MYMQENFRDLGQPASNRSSEVAGIDEIQKGPHKYI